MGWEPDAGIAGRYVASIGPMLLYVTPTGSTYTWWLVSASSFQESGTALNLADAQLRAIETARRQLREAGAALRLLATS